MHRLEFVPLLVLESDLTVVMCVEVSPPFRDSTPDGVRTKSRRYLAIRPPRSPSYLRLHAVKLPVKATATLGAAVVKPTATETAPFT